MATYELNFQSVNIPTNSGSISVTVKEDSNNDGTVENSDTISLSDGVTTYTTGDVFTGGGQMRLSFSFGPPSDVTVTADNLLPVDVTSSTSNEISLAVTAALTYSPKTVTPSVSGYNAEADQPKLSYLTKTASTDIKATTSNPTLRYEPLLQIVTETRTLPEYDLTPVGIVESSEINWDAEVEPGQDVRFEVSLDGGNTWTEISNGDSIPGLNPGDVVLGQSLLVRQILETRGITETPSLNYSKVEVKSQKSP